MEFFQSALYGVCEPIRSVLLSVSAKNQERIFEIRLRAGRPVMLTLPEGSAFLTGDGDLRFVRPKDIVEASDSDLQNSFALICQHSIQAHGEEIKRGYVSMKQGHRAGISGVGVVRSGEVVTFRQISGINIRIARNVTGVCEQLMTRLSARFGDIPGTLIFGPPGCGKTTMLRDFAKCLADRGRRVALIDQKGELNITATSADYDVISGVDKAVAAEMAVRNLNPEYILFDEIGNADEAAQVINCLNCGVRVITTMHAGNLQELLRRPIAEKLKASGALPGVVFLKNVGHGGDVLDWEDCSEGNWHCDAVFDGGADELAQKSLS